MERKRKRKWDVEGKGEEEGNSPKAGLLDLNCEENGDGWWDNGIRSKSRILFDERSNKERRSSKVNFVTPTL